MRAKGKCKLNEWENFFWKFNDSHKCLSSSVSNTYLSFIPVLKAYATVVLTYLRIKFSEREEGEKANFKVRIIY
jgi:hypothetical protein